MHVRSLFILLHLFLFALRSEDIRYCNIFLPSIPEAVARYRNRTVGYLLHIFVETIAYRIG